jgi:DNA-binding NarL/FixJ family response regulator
MLGVDALQKGVVMAAVTEGSGEVRVLVVDDIRLSRDGLIELLGRQPFVAAAVGVADAAGAMRLLENAGFEIVLLNMATIGSVGMCRELAWAAGAARLIALAVSGHDEEVAACAEAGVFSYVLRDQPPAAVIDAVAGAARGETSCPPQVAAALIRRVSLLSAVVPTAAPAAGLTRRESEILTLIEHGMSNKEIAGTLCIQVRTVKNHVHNLLEKLQVKRRGQAAALVRANARVRSGT